jgi:glycosyltransferase involved in cell wall biosynthesis
MSSWRASTRDPAAIDSTAMRCVHLVPDTRDAGAENQARYLLAGLRGRKGITPELAYFGAERAHRQFVELGLPMLHVPRRRRFRFDAYGRVRRLRRAYVTSPPQILHTWLLEANVIGLAAARAWPETRVVITQRGSWNELDHPGLVRLEQLLIRRADHAIANSSGGAEMLRTLGLPSERISVIPNGIPTSRVQLRGDRDERRAELGWAGMKVVAWMGRFADAKTVAQKDFPGLLAALHRLRSDRRPLLLALIGPTRDQLAARGLELPDWAQALGWRDQPADLLNAADVVAISSRTEGNSNVAGEALLVGTPVVTTDCGDHCEVVRMAGGQVVGPGDPEALAGALDAVLARDPDRAAIRRAAAPALSVERMVDRTLDVYERLMGG